jgi:hypothetical protein
MRGTWRVWLSSHQPRRYTGRRKAREMARTIGLRYSSSACRSPQRGENEPKKVYVCVWRAIHAPAVGRTNTHARTEEEGDTGREELAKSCPLVP